MVIGSLNLLDFVIGFPETPSHLEYDFYFQIVIGLQEVLALAPNLRHLDHDLSMVMRAGEAFDWNRVSFILEAVEFDAKKIKKWKMEGSLNTNLPFPIFPGPRTHLRHVCGRASRSQQECTPKVLGGSLEQLGWRTQSRPGAVCCRSNFDPRPSVIIIFYSFCPQSLFFLHRPLTIRLIWIWLGMQTLISKKGVIKCEVVFRLCSIAMVRAEKEGARTRNKLVKQLEDPRCQTSQLENLLNKTFAFNNFKTIALGLIMSDWIFKI